MCRFGRVAMRNDAVETTFRCRVCSQPARSLAFAQASFRSARGARERAVCGPLRRRSVDST
eukprot:3803041-Lingulodinium_polyedra.AAC.1